jgi:hypothetical protein
MKEELTDSLANLKRLNNEQAIFIAWLIKANHEMGVERDLQNQYIKFLENFMLSPYAAYYGERLNHAKPW